MMHLQQARTAARRQRADDAHAHLDEAAYLAGRVGERNGMRQHFGPANVAAWRVSIGVELAECAKAYEDATAAPIGIDTADRIAPQRIRNDPLARDLVLTLSRRGRRQVWELNSLCHRFGVGKPV
jgi:hypothetical protein